jgi:hypothetical protein
MFLIVEAIYEEELTKQECLLMDFTGRSMKFFIFVTPDGYGRKFSLLDTIYIDFNPLTKPTKKKKKLNSK